MLPEDAARAADHSIVDPARRDTAASDDVRNAAIYDRYSQDVLTFVPADQFFLRGR